ncbi:hypothetical protein [Spiroplasma endosymbiont of Virgichneumon dumeticola]
MYAIKNLLLVPVTAVSSAIKRTIGWTSTIANNCNDENIINDSESTDSFQNNQNALSM